MDSLGGLSDDVVTQEEFTVMDRANRLQIPAHMLQEIGAKGNKVKLEVVDGRIVIAAQDTVEEKAE
jgi:hypothetical protein